MNDITKTIAQHLVRLGLGYASQGPVQSVVANDGDRAGYVRLGDDQAGVELPAKGCEAWLAGLGATTLEDFWDAAGRLDAKAAEGRKAADGRHTLAGLRCLGGRIAWNAWVDGNERAVYEEALGLAVAEGERVFAENADAEAVELANGAVESVVVSDDDSDGPEFAIERIALSDIGKPDLVAEIESMDQEDRDSAEAYRFVTYGDDGYEESEGGVVLFVGNAGRAGICMNGDSSWTDASDAADAVRRYLTGNMVE